VSVSPLEVLANEIAACRACPRLVAWRERVAREKRRAYADWEYWGRPVPGFGDPGGGLVVVGLAPAAHGANRTGRMFTGDRSGDFLYAALHRAGFASQPTSRARGDGLTLSGAFITAPCRCAPPNNKPLPEELTRCAGFLDRELASLGRRTSVRGNVRASTNRRGGPSADGGVGVVLALGAIAWEAVLGWMGRRGVAIPRPRPRFAHGAELRLPGSPMLLGSYHVSQQNTQTGRLTAAMFDGILARARSELSPHNGPPGDRLQAWPGDGP
jgi:uracil-DNA glycosylase